MVVRGACFSFKVICFLWQFTNFDGKESRSTELRRM